MASLLTHQDPKQFLQSSIWGCGIWQELSSRCRQCLEHLHQPEALTVEELRDLQDQFAESLLDCYVHTRVCYRCKPSGTSAGRNGHEAIDMRDDLAEKAAGIHAESPTEESLDPEQKKVLPHRDLARRPSLRHLRESDERTAARSLGRFSVPAWNIEAARLQRP